MRHSYSIVVACLLLLAGGTIPLYDAKAQVTQKQDDKNHQTSSVSLPEFQWIDGGRFVQGTNGGERALQNAFPLSTTGQGMGNAESPAHVTWITKPFYIAKTEVTRGQFKAFVDATGYKTSAQKGETEMVGWAPSPDDAPLYQSYDFVRDTKFNWTNTGFEQSDDHPVVGVSYEDAKAYCEWLSDTQQGTYRLPTEAEWELVCRAGTATWFSFGDVAKGVVHDHANLGNVELELHRQHAAERQWLLDWNNDPSDGHVFTAPVASYAANRWGIYDMHGNVWEWCEDLWLDTIYKDYARPRFDRPCAVAVDPVNLDRPQTAANDFHTIRGGSWYNGDLIARSANRSYWDAQDAACYIGFRVVRQSDREVPSTASQAYRDEQTAIAAVEDAGGQLHSRDGISIDVRINSDTINLETLGQLKKISDLHHLSIQCRSREAKLTQKGLDTIAEIGELRHLDFKSGLDIESLDLSILANLNHLETLRFAREVPLNDKHLAALSGINSLVEFQCYASSELTDTGLSHLASNPKLKDLAVRETNAEGEFLHALSECPLESLSCTTRSTDRSGMSDNFASALKRFSKLQSLNLDGQRNLSDSTLKIIGDLKELRHLSLRQFRSTSDSGYQPLSKLQKLNSVNLTDCPAGDAAAKALSNIPRLSNVEIGSYYDDRSKSLTDEGVKSLSKAFSITNLKILSNQITDSGIKHLGRINRLSRLTLYSNQITGTGLGPIAELPQLNDIALQTPGLRDIALQHMAQAKSVQKLRLAHRGIQPPSALTNDGILALSNSTWMKEIWIPRNGAQISEATIDQLNMALPATSVIPYTVSWEQ